MRDRRSIPPEGSGGWELARLPFAWRGARRAVADGLVALSSRITGEALDDRLSRTFPGTFNELGVDPFGADVDTLRVSVALLVHLHRSWFRTEVHGIENIPDGRVLVVANHSGQIPIDGVVIALAMMLDTDRPRFVRGMVERFIGTVPYVSVWFGRLGQVVGTQDNAKRLLEAEEALLVFPEGVRGIAKPFRDRYRLRPFGQGFVRLALEANTPIVPVAVIGAEEQYVSVADLRRVAELFGLPAFPIIPQWLIGALVPLPVKYRIYFGEPIRLSGDPDDEDSVIEEKVWTVQTTIQSMINRGLRERRAIFW